jgi:hypothetical protein
MGVLGVQAGLNAEFVHLVNFSFGQNIGVQGDPSKPSMGEEGFVARNQGRCANDITHGAQFDDQNSLLNGCVGWTGFAMVSVLLVRLTGNVSQKVKAIGLVNHGHENSQMQENARPTQLFGHNFCLLG